MQNCDRALERPFSTVFPFPMLATLLFAFFFASSAPSPLFLVFQNRWAFSSAMLTVAFGIYAIILLGTLLVAGSLSDHVGRRPIISVALIIQTAAMILFLTADGIDGLIAARMVQGVSMGIVNGALAAAVVEAAPVSRKSLGSMVTSIAPMAGLAAGALVTGLSVTWTSTPEQWIFGSLSVLFPIGAAFLFWVPETTEPRAGALASLVPRVSVVRKARAQFVRGLPLLFVVWALCGLFIALAPSMMLHVFNIDSGTLNGLTVATLCGFGAVTPPLLRSIRPAATAALGMAATSVGLLILLLSFVMCSVELFFIGAAVAGSGSGAAFSALVQTPAPLADENERAELFAAIFVASYLSLSLAPIVAGFLITPFGLLHTTQGYLLLLLIVPIVATLTHWAALRRSAAVINQ